ncbi:MAG: hypothetical protein AB1941_05860 [Gemmatimonadota bacterium]
MHGSRADGRRGSGEAPARASVRTIESAARVPGIDPCTRAERLEEGEIARTAAELRAARWTVKEGPRQRIGGILRRIGTIL